MPTAAAHWSNEPGHCSEPAWLDAHRIVHVYSSPIAPTDLWITDLRDGSRRHSC